MIDEDVPADNRKLAEKAPREESAARPAIYVVAVKPRPTKILVLRHKRALLGGEEGRAVSVHIADALLKRFLDGCLCHGR
jgi:hypothetical protein